MRRAGPAGPSPPLTSGLWCRLDQIWPDSATLGVGVGHRSCASPRAQSGMEGILCFGFRLGPMNPKWGSTLSAMSESPSRLKRFGQGVGSKSHTITEWIGSRPPRVWATIYVLVIPLAGFIFWALPAGSFYDSNLTREAGFDNDLATVASLLKPAIQRQEYGEYIGHQLSAPTWNSYGARLTMDRNSVNIPVGSVSVDSSGNIAFAIQGWAQSPPKSPLYGVSSFGDLVSLSTGYPSYTWPKSGASPLVGYPVTFATSGVSNGQAPLNILLPGVAGETAINPDASVMWMPPPLRSLFSACQLPVKVIPRKPLASLLGCAI